MIMAAVLVFPDKKQKIPTGVELMYVPKIENAASAVGQGFIW